MLPEELTRSGKQELKVLGRDVSHDKRYKYVMVCLRNLVPTVTRDYFGWHLDGDEMRTFRNYRIWGWVDCAYRLFD